jgi:hypothetical protein
MSMNSNGAGFLAQYDLQFSSVQIDKATMFLPGATNKEAGLVNFQSNADPGATVTYFSAFAGVQYMGHKYGSGEDPRPTNGDGYTWFSDNNQRMIIGAGSTNITNLDAHLTLWSNPVTPNPLPHLRFFQDYTGAVQANTMYLSGVDSKLHFEGSAGQDIILEDLTSSEETVQFGSAGQDIILEDLTSSEETVQFSFSKGGAISTGNVISVASQGSESNPIGFAIPYDLEIIDISVNCGLSTISVLGDLIVEIREETTSSAGTGSPLTSAAGSLKRTVTCSQALATTYNRTFTDSGITGVSATQGNVLFVAIGTNTFTGSVTDLTVSVTCKRI